ncbi:DgyrCDS5895 [Dimorphilus gyrociliatus]|uniref:DgyrCDS5895 n=1 Tax=Dimorphilus gyrociliatus TaxID=2664684 RepID=A0A7I8VNQ0_9ANNE|nr:DgyrCDS5895 [Dimorphilus gyrociliatus]
MLKREMFRLFYTNSYNEDIKKETLTDQEQKDLNTFTECIDLNDEKAISEILTTRRDDISDWVFFISTRESFLKSNKRIFNLLSVAYICRIIDLSGNDIYDTSRYLQRNIDILREITDNWLNNWFGKVIKTIHTYQTSNSKEKDKRNRFYQPTRSANISIWNKSPEWFSRLFLTTIVGDIDNQWSKNHKDAVRILLSFLTYALVAKNRYLLEVIATSKKLQHVRYSFYLVLSCNYPDKFSFFQNLTTRKASRIEPSYKYQDDVSNHYNEIVHIAIIGEKFRKIYPTENQSRTVWNFLKENYQFTVNLALQSIINDEEVLCSLLSCYGEVYQKLFQSNDFEAKGFPSLKSVKVVFYHKRFYHNANVKNFFFRLLMSSANISSSVNEFLKAFRYIISRSDNAVGLSQDVVDYAINRIINNGKFTSENVNMKSLVKTSLTFLSMLTWYGYTFKNLDLSNTFLNALRKENVISYVINSILVMSDQKNYNEITLKLYEQKSVKPLKDMAIIAIRRNIKKPFRKNLTQLTSVFKLPQQIERCINFSDYLEPQELFPL